VAGTVAAIRTYCGWIFDCHVGALPQVLFVVNCIPLVDAMAILLRFPVISFASRDAYDFTNAVAFADLVKAELKITQR
jgi:hypothetical protein